MTTQVYMIGNIQKTNPPTISPFIELTTDHFDMNGESFSCNAIFINDKLQLYDNNYITINCTFEQKGNYIYLYLNNLSIKLLSKLIEEPYIVIIKSDHYLDLSDINRQLYFKDNTLIYKLNYEYYMLKYSNSTNPIDIQKAMTLINNLIDTQTPFPFIYKILNKNDFTEILKLFFTSSMTQISSTYQTVQGSLWIGRIVYGYKLIDKIGEGGNASVFKAESNNIVYAIKIPKIAPPSATQTITIQAFKTFQDISNESSNLINLSSKSPNLVKIFAIYIDVNKIRIIYSGDLTTYFQYPPAIVMEYMEGGDIWQVIKDQFIYSTMWEKVVAKIWLEIVEALEVIHDNGYVHLDVKPSNFLLSKKVNANTAAELLDLLSSGQLIVKLGDLGSARKIGETITQLTPEYAPPEQFTFNKADPSMDIFSLGASLYALYKGKKGFNSPSITRQQDIYSEYTKYYSILLSKANTQFEKYLLKMTSPNPKDRPTIKEVKKMLSSLK